MAVAWLSDWRYRKKITIKGQAGAGPNYQVLLKVGESSGAAGYDFYLDKTPTSFPTGKNVSGDLRFTSNDGKTELPFWVEKISGASPNSLAYIWVKVIGNLNADREIYCYWYKSGATNVSNGDHAGILFDDFGGASVDGSKWTEVDNDGVNAVAGSVLTLTMAPPGAAWNHEGFASNSYYGNKIAIRAYCRHTLNPNIALDLSCWVGVGGYTSTNDQYQGAFRGDGTEPNDRQNVGYEVENGVINAVEYDNTNYDGVWYTIDTYFDYEGLNKVFRKDDTQKDSQTHSATFFNNLRPRMRAGTHANAIGNTVLEVDWIFVRKYNNPEPSFLSADSTETRRCRVFLDGFESGNYDLWDANNLATIKSSAVHNMDGNYCVALAANGHLRLESIISASITEMYFAWRFRMESAATGRILVVEGHDGASYQEDVRLQIDSSRNIDVVRLGSSSAIHHGTVSLSLNTTYRLEAYIKLHNTSGMVITKINGVTDLSISGVDTLASHASAPDLHCISFGRGQLAAGSPAFIMDNFIWDDAAWIGNTKIMSKVPTATGAATEWTATGSSSAENWDCVEEVPAGDADFVSTNTADEVDLYNMSDISGSDTFAIKAVQIQARMKKASVPSINNVNMVIKNTNIDYSSSKAVQSSWHSLFAIWETNPDTSAEFTTDEIDSMQIGVRSRT